MAIGPVYIEHRTDPPLSDLRACSGAVALNLREAPAGASIVQCALCFPTPTGLRVALRSADTIDLLNELSRRLSDGAGSPERNQQSHGNRIGDVRVHPPTETVEGYYTGPNCHEGHRHASAVAALRCAG